MLVFSAPPPVAVVGGGAETGGSGRGAETLTAVNDASSTLTIVAP
jgi:hypothetical protein